MPPTLVKRVLEAGLLHLGPATLARARRRRRALVLAYHNIVPAGEGPGGDASLHLRREAFARQLDILQRECEVVPLRQALARAGDAIRPRVAITFDDAYAGALTVGRDELLARGLPATVFVAPGLLDGHAFWWDATGGGSPAWRHAALVEEYGHPRRVRERWEREGGTWEPGPAHARSASREELAAWADGPGLDVAAHGWLHLNFAAAPAAELERELRESRSWLAQRDPSATPLLAYPYGLSSPEVERRAREAGYAGALRVNGGWLPAGARRRTFAEPRLNVPAGVSLDGFRLRIAGLVGG